MEDGGSSFVPIGGYTPSTKIPKKWLVPLIIVAILLGAGLIFFALQGSGKKDNTTGQADNPKAAESFYTMLSKGAAQSNIRVAQYRTTYATKADLESKNDPGFIQSSIAEVVNNKYHSAYAQRLYDKTEFRMERCMDGAAYADGLGSAFGSQRPAPKSLVEANEYLKQMYRLTETAQFSTCPVLGIMPGGILDLAPSRLSDGLMPVTLTESQAMSWKNKLQAANLFTVKDEGISEHNSKQLRKYSFTPKGNALEINKQLYDIFYETAEIEKIIREHPKAEWKYEFISINIANQGGIKGYYLVDEQTGLPVYSELSGIGEDKEKDPAVPVRKANIGLNKQTYAYPMSPTIELTSPLEILE